MEVAKGGEMWPDVAMAVLSLTAASGPHGRWREKENLGARTHWSRWLLSLAT